MKIEIIRKKIDITPNSELTVPPLSQDELKWIQRLQSVLTVCPKRLELTTIGDASLNVVDAEGAKKSGLGDGDADRDGIVLASIPGGPTVHGISG